MHLSAARPLVAVLILSSLAGCGAKKVVVTTSSATATVLSLHADATALKFDKSALTAKPGRVTIVMKNPSQLQHDVAIQGNGVNVKGKIVGNGGTSTVSATLKPGTYTFFCSVDSHRQAGMQGTLTVK